MGYTKLEVSYENHSRCDGPLFTSRNKILLISVKLLEFCISEQPGFSWNLHLLVLFSVKVKKLVVVDLVCYPL